MSEYGDQWKELRKARQEARRNNSTECWRCLRRVWNFEALCSECGTPNQNHKQEAGDA